MALKIKTARPRIFTIDIECPHCENLIANIAEDGQLSFSIHEALPKILTCQECGSKSLAPKRVAGEDLSINE